MLCRFKPPRLGRCAHAHTSLGAFLKVPCLPPRTAELRRMRMRSSATTPARGSSSTPRTAPRRARLGSVAMAPSMLLQRMLLPPLVLLALAPPPTAHASSSHAALPPPQPRRWAVLNNTNACPGSTAGKFLGATRRPIPAMHALRTAAALHCYRARSKHMRPPGRQGAAPIDALVHCRALPAPTVHPGPNTSWAVHKVASPGACTALCKGNATCTVWAWSPNSHTCYFRLDHIWRPGWSANPCPSSDIIPTLLSSPVRSARACVPRACGANDAERLARGALGCVACA